MFAHSKNLKDGWSDSLTDIENEIDRQRAWRSYTQISHILEEQGGLTKSEVKVLMQPLAPV